MLDDIETKHPMGYVDIFLFNYIEGVKLNYILYILVLAVLMLSAITN